MALIDLYLCLLFLTGVHMYRKAYRRVCTQWYRGGQCRDNFSFLFVA